MLINHVATAKEKAKAKIKNSLLVSSFAEMTPNEIDDWVNENIRSVADIKEFIALLVVAIQALELNK